MKYLGYVLGFVVLVNLLERWVTAYEFNVRESHAMAKLMEDRMSLAFTDAVEFPEDSGGLPPIN